MIRRPDFNLACPLAFALAVLQARDGHAGTQVVHRGCHLSFPDTLVTRLAELCGVVGRYRCGVTGRVCRYRWYGLSLQVWCNRKSVVTDVV